MIILSHRRPPSLLRPVMANKLAIVALAAAAVAAAPALAQEAPSPSPGSQQALRVCEGHPAGPDKFLAGCEELHVAQESWGFIVDGKFCVVLDDCLDLTQGSPRERRATSDADDLLHPANRSLSAILRFFTIRARLRPRARKFPRRQAAAVVVGAHRVTHGALAPKAKLK